MGVRADGEDAPAEFKVALQDVLRRRQILQTVAEAGSIDLYPLPVRDGLF